MYHGIHRSIAAVPIDRSARAIALRSRQAARAEERIHRAARAEIDGRVEHRRSARPAQARAGIAVLRRP